MYNPMGINRNQTILGSTESLIKQTNSDFTKLIIIFETILQIFKTELINKINTEIHGWISFT